MKNIITLIFITLFLTSCFSVPLKTEKESNLAKEFKSPTGENSGLYVYRNSWVGQALRKDVWVDGKCLGESSSDIFFYQQIAGNKKHTISTESEFSPNDLTIYTESNKNYFVRQYIKIGLFVGGAGVELVDEEKGKKDILRLKLAKNGICSK